MTKSAIYFLYPMFYIAFLAFSFIQCGWGKQLLKNRADRPGDPLKIPSGKFRKYPQKAYFTDVLKYFLPIFDFDFILIFPSIMVLSQ